MSKTNTNNTTPTYCPNCGKRITKGQKRTSTRGRRLNVCSKCANKEKKGAL